MNEFERLNSALGELYLQSPRISELLGIYETDPSPATWELIKARERANEEKLIKLYNFLEAFASEALYSRNRQLHDDIRTIVEAESVRFYSSMRCFPEMPIPSDRACIRDLAEQARRFEQKSEEKALEFQHVLSGYLHPSAQDCGSRPTTAP